MRQKKVQPVTEESEIATISETKCSFSSGDLVDPLN